jgi:hypothetical protein
MLMLQVEKCGKSRVSCVFMLKKWDKEQNTTDPHDIALS